MNKIENSEKKYGVIKAINPGYKVDEKTFDAEFPEFFENYRGFIEGKRGRRLSLPAWRAFEVSKMKSQAWGNDGTKRRSDSALKKSDKKGSGGTKGSE